MDHPKPWLKYVDADHIDDATLELDDMPVLAEGDEKIGTVNGLIVDDASLRPYYVVVDSGGWFKSKHILMPIGQLRLTPDKTSLIVPLSKPQIDQFPGFDLDKFDELDTSTIKAINDATLEVTEPGALHSPTTKYDDAWQRRSYTQPAWWPGFANPDVPDGSRKTEQSASDQGEVSPHFDGRAQPGDVIGIETGGERTYVGDTKDDENERRRDAENARH